MRQSRSRPLPRALLAIALVAACERSTVPDPEDGAFVGRWAGRPWVGDAGAFLSTGTPQGDILYVYGSSPRGGSPWGADETLSARVVFTGPGLYALDGGDISFFVLVGGDEQPPPLVR